MVKAGVIGFCTLLSLASPVVAQQQVYAVMWGSSQLGVVTFDPQTNPATGAVLSSDLQGTLLGLLDGSFAAISRPAPDRSGGVIYRATSDSPRKKRVSTISLTATGIAAAATVTPARDMTKFTRPGNVPPGVLNPVQAFERLALARSCPQGAFKIYDARRVVEVTPTSATQSGTVLTCKLAYRVILGPGHLRPLGVKSVAMTLEFDPAVAKTGPRLISLGADLLRLDLRRMAVK